MENTKLEGELDLTVEDVRAKIVSEVAVSLAPLTLNEDEFTIMQFAMFHEPSLTRNTAKRRLERAIKDGTLVKRPKKVLHDGHWCYAYRVPDN